MVPSRTRLILVFVTLFTLSNLSMILLIALTYSLEKKVLNLSKKIF